MIVVDHEGAEDFQKVWLQIIKIFEIKEQGRKHETAQCVFRTH